nr:MAG TPA: hypothetical protein [Bacteriophage sp.]
MLLRSIHDVLHSRFRQRGNVGLKQYFLEIGTD